MAMHNLDTETGDDVIHRSAGSDMDHTALYARIWQQS
jgi:hypothetical protein